MAHGRAARSAQASQPSLKASPARRGKWTIVGAVAPATPNGESKSKWRWILPLGIMAAIGTVIYVKMSPAREAHDQRVKALADLGRDEQGKLGEPSETKNEHEREHAREHG